jgi:hypothetical protein
LQALSRMIAPIIAVNARHLRCSLFMFTLRDVKGCVG